MADAIMLSPETYDRLKRLLDDWDQGFEKTIKLGSGLKIEERGTDYLKIGIDSSVASNVFPAALTVTDGTNNVTGVRTIGFQGTLFSITAGAPGSANVNLRTTTCN